MGVANSSRNLRNLKHPSISHPHILMLLGYHEGIGTGRIPAGITHVRVRVGPGPTTQVMHAYFTVLSMCHI